MNATETLIRICDVKFTDIRKRSDIDLWTEEDKTDLSSWPEETIHRVLLKMGPTNCPYCIRHNGDCKDCSYGKRHGICKHARSEYRKAETERRQNHMPYLSAEALIEIGQMLKEYKKCQ
ncbi:MAG: hypothetical protein KJ737_16655 [Proteobacteria bacterium]|nr:hypothetical protein [Pseudomonadota bacterium]